MFEHARIGFEAVHFASRQRKIEELADAMIVQHILKRLITVRNDAQNIARLFQLRQSPAHILRDDAVRLVDLAHVNRDFRSHLNGPFLRSTQGEQPAAAVFDPELFGLAGMGK